MDPNIWRHNTGYTTVPPAMPYYPAQAVMMPYPMMLAPGGHFIPVLTEAPKEKPKKASSTTPNPTICTAPPGLLPNHTFLFKNEPTCTLRVFPFGTVAESIASGLEVNNLPATRGFQAPESTTFKELVAMLGQPEGSVVYSVHEAGNGAFRKGCRVDTATAAGNMSMKAKAWATDRPNWVVVEKPKKK